MIERSEDLDEGYSSPLRVAPKRYTASSRSDSFDLLPVATYPINSTANTFKSSAASAFVPVHVSSTSAPPVDDFSGESYSRAYLTPGPLYNPQDNDENRLIQNKTVTKASLDESDLSNRLIDPNNIHFSNKNSLEFPPGSFEGAVNEDASNFDFLDSLARRQLNSIGFNSNFTDYAIPPDENPEKSLFTLRSASATKAQQFGSSRRYQDVLHDADEDVMAAQNKNKSLFDGNIFNSSIESLSLNPKTEEFRFSGGELDFHRYENAETLAEYYGETQSSMPVSGSYPLSSSYGIQPSAGMSDRFAYGRSNESMDATLRTSGQSFERALDREYRRPNAYMQPQQLLHHQQQHLQQQQQQEYMDGSADQRLWAGASYGYPQRDSSLRLSHPSGVSYPLQQSYNMEPSKTMMRSTDSLSSAHNRRPNSSSNSPQRASRPQPMPGNSRVNLSLQGSSESFSRRSKEDARSLRLRRDEFVESPSSKNAFKEFSQQLKNAEKVSVEHARAFAEDSLLRMPPSARWRVYLELAEMARKNNEFDQAREMYRHSTNAQPLFGQSWLDWSKMEEDCGDLMASLRVLRKGLSRCSFNEGLLTRALKQLERLHGIQEARGILSILKYESIDKVWRSILEGALLESRIGRIDVARRFFKYLMHHISWFGPIYLEAFRLEEKADNIPAALTIIRKGLHELPRYGPLWFGLLRICECIDAGVERKEWMLGNKPRLSKVMAEAVVAIQSISKELVWKVHFEIATMQERAADVACIGLYYFGKQTMEEIRSSMYDDVRRSYVRSILACPQNLRWKVLLVASRLELVCGRMAVLQKFINRAWLEVPEKSKSVVFLECSRVEEYIGNVDVARDILKRARVEVRSDWKIFMESVMLESRQGNLKGAIAAVQEALNVHPGAGRLWSIFIHLCHRVECCALQSIVQGPTKHEVLLHALSRCPKSGEIWCEGSRSHLNPALLDCFDLTSVQRYLCFAAQFTPQYGDTFLESLRLEIVTQTLLVSILIELRIPVQWFLSTFLSEDEETDTYSLARNTPLLLSILAEYSPTLELKEAIIAVENMQYEFSTEIHTSQLQLDCLRRRCANADPNFGSVWFYSRTRPSDTPASILRSTGEIFTHELSIASHVYGRALGRYIYKCISSLTDEVADASVSSAITWYLIEATKVFSAVDGSSPPMYFIDNGRCVLSASDFFAALIEMNRTVSLGVLSYEDKRFVLFGADQIVP